MANFETLRDKRQKVVCEIDYTTGTIAVRQHGEKTERYATLDIAKLRAFLQATENQYYAKCKSS